jgi:hypothetical protein
MLNSEFSVAAAAVASGAERAAALARASPAHGRGSCNVEGGGGVRPRGHPRLPQHFHGFLRLR